MAADDGEDVEMAEAEADAEAPQLFDWSAHYDDEGNLYYYNSVTEESAWEAPEGTGFNPPDQPPPAVDDKDKDDGGPPTNSDQSKKNEYDWSAHYDEEGQLYYYNEKTDTSAWEAPPEGFHPPEGDPPPGAAAGAEAVEEVAGEGKGGGEEEPSNVSNEAKEQEEAASEADQITDNATEDKNASTETDDDFAVGSDDQKPAAAAAAAAATVVPNSDEDEEPNKKTDEPSKIYDWSAHYDSEAGRLYYYNSATEESAWEPPPDGLFNPPPVDDNDENDAQGGDSATAGATNDDDAAVEWVAYHDDEGNEYYYNATSGETSWDKPDKFTPYSAELEEAVASSQTAKDDDNDGSVTKSPSGMMEQDDDDSVIAEDNDTKPPASSSPPQQQLRPATPEIVVAPVDPAVQRLRDAEAALNGPDSILEPDCMSHLTQVVAANEGNPQTAIAALIENYNGQTAVCGLLSKWLTDLQKRKQAQTVSSAASSTAAASAKKSNGSSSAQPLPNNSSLADNDANADKIRGVAQSVISKMVKERFTKEAGDGILDLGKKEAAFLQDMMDSPRWRKLLIDLSAKHKDSAVLLFCLRAISKRGHHREIAKRVNQSEHFAVFNAMLLSELAVIGGQAVAAGTDVAAAAGLDELMQDLRRACCATSYTYLYSMEMLRRLQNMAREELLAAAAETATSDNGGGDNGDVVDDGQVRFRRALRKWETLSETLENSMLDPTQLTASSSMLIRKRRLDIALTVSELHQRQRRSRRKLGDETHKDGGGDDTGIDNNNRGNSYGHHDDLETALLTLLRRHSIGIQLDDAVLDQLLPSGLDLDTRGVGNLLVRHPLAVRALLGHLYKPGATRVTSASTKNKCARLVALAVLGSEELAKKQVKSVSNGSTNNSGSEEESPDELAVTRMIVQGSQLCELVETMVSFLVTADPKKTSQAPPSAGLKLCSLALKCAPVGLGVVIWAREFTRGPDFAASASFPTLSFSILSLVRLVAMEHPFARADALQVALAFLRHSNSDISYQKVNSIKECGLRLLLFLLVKGEVVPVLSNMTVRLQTGSSELDASLVRYFVAGALEVVQPPLSPVFVRMFGSLLKAPKAVDAVRSSYFAESNRSRLVAILRSFKEVRLYDGSPLGKEDEMMVSTLLKMYQVE